MVSNRQRSEKIREFILTSIADNPVGISKIIEKKFRISRQAANKHLKKLEQQGSIASKKSGRNRYYYLTPIEEWKTEIPLTEKSEEGVVWNEFVSPSVKNLPDNVIDIWHYGFTEMLNNAIDHSGGTMVDISLKKTAAYTEISIIDNGEGIFKKIQNALDLHDPRHSVLELSKGKFTTDPENHTGQGIFFSSRIFDNFSILSHNIFFSHTHDEIKDWIFKGDENKSIPGTGVFMKLSNNSSRKIKKVFDAYASPDEYGFIRTVVPVFLAQYGDDKLISRSQAKRLLFGIDKFKKVIFDFDGVETIGQAFADEIFRVFTNKNQEIELQFVNANQEVKSMILRAKTFPSEKVKL